MNRAVSPARISGPLSDTASSSGMSSLRGGSASGSARRAASSAVRSPLLWSASANRTLAATESGAGVRWAAIHLRTTTSTIA